MREENKQTAQPAVNQALIDAARQGDNAARTELYEATSLEIYRTIHAMIRDEDLTMDVLQESYLNAFSKLDQLRDAAAFLPWLRQIAVNECRVQLRKKQPLLFSELSDAEVETELELPDLRPETQPELALDRKETERLIREILNKLTDSQRLLVGMYYYEQIPVREIAESLGLSQGTVKVQLHNSRKRLEREIRGMEAKGVKLFGLTPMSFLLALLKRAEPAGKTGGKALAGILSESGVKSVGVHVGRRFFETVAGKLLLGLITVGVIGGGVAGWHWIQSRAAPLGDLRPPSLADSADDLSTEPTILETEITEPATTEAESTEPETTEAPTTEAVTTEPPATEAQPTEPKPTEPKPTEPAPTEPPTTEAPSVIQDWYWWKTTELVRQQTELYDLPWESSYEMKILMDTSIRPRVYSDHPEVVSTSYFEFGNPSGYSLTITSRGPGTAHVYFEAGGEVLTITVTNPEHPETVLSISEHYSCSTAEQPVTSLENCPVNTYWLIDVRIQGWAEPVFSTDDPSVVEIGGFNTVEDGTTSWIKKGYQQNGYIIARGEAHIYMYLNGVIQKTWTVHAYDDTVIETEPPEETETP